MIRRHIARLLALLLLVAGCSSARPTADPTSDPTPSPTTRSSGPILVTTGCADLVVLGLRGAGQAADKNLGAGQEILASVRAMSADLHRKSGTTVRLEGIPYRAEIAPTSDFHRGNVEDGMSRTQNRITELARRCPDSRVALVGFSQGAQVVHELVAKLPAASAKRIALVALIADPIRNPDDSIASWTYGKAAPGPGKFGAGAAVGSALQDQAITFCAAGDEICNWPPGGYDGPLSDTHRHFYETSAHARSTGRQMAGILRKNGL